MNTENINLEENQLSFDLTRQGEISPISIPLDVEGMLNPDQWHLNTARRLKYAAKNSKVELEEEEWNEILYKVISADIVKEEIRQNRNFWEAADFTTWLNSKDPSNKATTERALAEEEGNARSEVVDDPASPTENETKEPSRPVATVVHPASSRLTIKNTPPDNSENPNLVITDSPPNSIPWPKIIGVVAVLLLLALGGGYYFSLDKNMDDGFVENKERLKRDAAVASTWIENCVLVAGETSVSVVDFVSEDQLDQIRDPYLLFVEAERITNSSDENYNLLEAAESYINEYLSGWETRCDCKLVYDCLE